MANFLSVATDELYRIFHLLNVKYFDSYLPEPMITIQSGARKNAQGWFTTYKAWSHKETEEALYEINMSAEYLNRNIIEIVGTLQHELVHYSNKLAEIKDASDNVHNKKFKSAAEKVDLIVEKSNSYGWGITACNPTLIKFITDEIQPNAEVFNFFRIIPEKPKAPKSQFKYECTTCGIKVYGKRDLGIVCSECNQGLVMEDDE